MPTMPAWTWEWHPHPETWGLVLALFLGYQYALRRIGPRKVRDGQPVATRGQKIAFTSGIAVLLIAVEWPVHDLAEGYLYSVHMLQHMTLSLVVPPLLMVGTPPWLVRTLIPPRAMRIARRLTRPLIALVIFNATIVITHWPVLVNRSVGNEGLHFGLHAVLVLASMIMWTPVLSPVLELPRLSLPAQMFYLFLQSIVPTVPASFLTFGERPLYAAYDAFPHLWGISTLADQRTAGLIMKLLGGFVLWGFIMVIFFRWAKIERDEGIDVIQMHGVDRELNRMEMVDR